MSVQGALKNREARSTRAGGFEPGYVGLLQSGELRERVREAYRRLEDCHLCPRNCGVNRRAGDLGLCRTGAEAVVAGAGPHFGEEPPLVGARGSGTIFFANCNLNCSYCQNYDISQEGLGSPVAPQDLAATMLNLQEQGCHNINLVSPSHVAAPILAALAIAAQAGLRLPLVYNTGGYDALETLALLDGVVDIYMPDMKYDDAEAGKCYSGVCDYPATNRAAVREMHRQVGDLVCDRHGVALRGLLVRHLVLPNDLAGTEGILRFLADGVSPHTYLNIMDQYRPCYRAQAMPELSRPVSPQEYQRALKVAEEVGLTRLDRRPSRMACFQL